MENDIVKGKVSVGVGMKTEVKEGFSEKAKWHIRKFEDPDGSIERASRAGMPMGDLLSQFGDPADELVIEGNLMLNEGINELWKLVSTSGATKFDNSSSYIGVGNDNTAAAADQTGLIGSSKKYVAMDGGYPTAGTSQKSTWRSTFGVADANWHWQEITVANGSSDAAKNLNRKVQDLGTKASGTTWICTLEITLS